jgi:hypothetical protein
VDDGQEKEKRGMRKEICKEGREKRERDKRKEGREKEGERSVYPPPLCEIMLMIEDLILT